MAKTNAERQRDWKARQREKMAQEASADQQLLREFVREFSSSLRFSLEDVTDEPDLYEPVRLTFKMATETRPRLVVFAHARGIDVETLLDKVTVVGMKNLSAWTGMPRKYLVE